MTTTQTTSLTSAFETAEGLRQALERLHMLDAAGEPAWRDDPEAEQLMVFAIHKYRSLARTHRCEPDDAAYAAFEAMRTRAVRTADDPWAVVTRAVQVSLIAEERATALLCSNSQARRQVMRGHHDARRFCEYENDVLEYHPALRVPAPEAATPQASSASGSYGDSGPMDPSDPASQHRRDRPTTPFEATDMVIALFTCLGWPASTITCAVDYIASRLSESKTRAAAHSILRRDEAGRAALDLDRRAWATVLRLVLGSPDPTQQHTRAGHGLLTLFLCGYTAAEFLADDALVLEISQTAPAPVRRASA
ncbi:serine/arginine repetitive matrix protein 2 [Nocardioides sp. J2M5]|uniref:serine/arginine repetitive matrix protein 2 n=1 Tax=Nocardioides palaemonis TaxID=2829810 RepID=UPI001BA8E36D|nr:serine/arginine repetitive matrix protein 2 [Nocardioides palaemonis]MBS2938509.1 serine/arginine repetitive matrix protein 2 [Nocardioides palaemonis]